MRLVTAKEMRSLDAHAINNIGIPGIALMELAGAGTARAILKRWPGEGSSFLVVAGKGNNGGDGYVTARHLTNAGCEVNIVVLGNEESIAGDAKTNLMAAKALKIPIVEINSTADILYLEEMFHTADFIIDAIFGTGLDREVTGIPREMISAINASPAIKIAIDMPSGLCADTGAVMGDEAIQADLTVTFGYGKIGQFTSPGFSYCGEIDIVDISLPAVSHGRPTCFLLTDAWIRDHLPFRPRGGHKGTFGHLAIIAGSRGKIGAAIMCSEAAISMGSGLVTLVSPADVQDILMNRLTEAMCAELCAPGVEPSLADMDHLMSLTREKDVVVIGPGIPVGEGMFQLLAALIERTEVPLIIDADGLNLLARDPSILKKAGAPVIITPHPGEMARLTGKSVEEIQHHRRSTASSFAREHNVYVTLKGARSIIAAPDGRTAINPTGNSGMGTGGSGDVLTGMIGALVAQRSNPFDAMAVGVFLHGRSGDLVAQERGELSLRATDLIDYLPNALFSIRGHEQDRFSGPS
ncbi:NAD(P)H-hydrate dehydratase [Myxococcota bacterium]|nr:NAD(P)H-hydrate dehydratase [Myxococcota bacterium]MBU1537260.1 NAD(P)H-hydrate dehydratase [Myxococcota bacterium]